MAIIPRLKAALETTSIEHDTHPTRQLRSLDERLYRRSVEKRFLSYVTQDDPSGCWIWHGAKTHDGYGVLSAAGKLWKASRLAYLFFVGEIPEGLFVLHHCDIPACVNPEHLFIGTNQDNANDKVAKGRDHHGEPGKTPTTSTQREEIIRKYQNGDVTQQQLAHDYGLTERRIRRILGRK